MKQSVSYHVAVVAALILFGFGTAYGVPPPPVPEPGTLALLGAAVAGGVIGLKVLSRKK